MNHGMADNAGVGALRRLLRQCDIGKLLVLISQRTTLHTPMLGCTLQSDREMAPVVCGCHRAFPFMGTWSDDMSAVCNQLPPHSGDLLEIPRRARFDDDK